MFSTRPFGRRKSAQNPTRAESNVSGGAFVPAEDALLEDMERENANRIQAYSARVVSGTTSVESASHYPSGDDDARLASIYQVLEGVPTTALQTYLHGAASGLTMGQMPLESRYAAVLQALLAVYGDRLVRAAVFNWVRDPTAKRNTTLELFTSLPDKPSLDGK